jgi:hypothetical protein
MLIVYEVAKQHLMSFTGGVSVLQWVDIINQDEHLLQEYGKQRILSHMPPDLAVKLCKQEGKVQTALDYAVRYISKEPEQAQFYIKKFESACVSLRKGYTRVINTAKELGLEPLPINYLSAEVKGEQFYVVQDEDMKEKLQKELDNRELVIYTMREIFAKIDNFELKLKKNFQAKQMCKGDYETVDQ